MLFLVVGVLVIAGAGAMIFTMRRSEGSDLLNINARLGRYGLVSPSGATKLVAPDSKSNKTGLTKSMDKLVERGGFGAKIAGLLEQADLKMTPAEYVTISLVAFLVAMLVGLIVKGSIGLLALGVVGLAAPWWYLRHRIKKRKKAFVGQLADMAQMMGNSMRAGFSIIQSMELVGNEGPKPASDEFERVITEVKLGLPLDTALDHLLQRQPSEDLGLMVVAINVQRQIGGNLSEILAVISQTIRERVRFERDLKALTAQARYSSYIITALPVGVGIVINFMDHEYESYLYTATLGHLMIGAALAMLGLGFFFLNKIATIEV